jgi:hypothetical protein
MRNEKVQPNTDNQGLRLSLTGLSESEGQARLFGLAFRHNTNGIQEKFYKFLFQGKIRGPKGLRGPKGEPGAVINTAQEVSALADQIKKDAEAVTKDKGEVEGFLNSSKDSATAAKLSETNSAANQRVAQTAATSAEGSATRASTSEINAGRSAVVSTDAARDSLNLKNQVETLARQTGADAQDVRQNKQDVIRAITEANKKARKWKAAIIGTAVLAGVATALSIVSLVNANNASTPTQTQETNIPGGNLTINSDEIIIP